MAPLQQIKDLRARGFQVDETLTKSDAQRLESIALTRSQGFTVAQDATPDELSRLEKIIALRAHGIDSPETLPADEVQTLYDSSYKVRHLIVRLRGVSHKNRDNSHRQRIIRELRPLENLELSRDTANRVDPFAVAVLRQTGEQVGYLSAELAPEICEQMSKGFRHGVYVTSITGGSEDKPTLGVSVLILIAEPGVSDDSIAAYFNRRLARAPSFLAETGATTVSMPSRSF